jgi:hypothetical protein
MTQVSNGLSGSALLLNLTPILSDPTLCPTQSSATRLLSKQPSSSANSGAPGTGGTTTRSNSAASATSAANSALNSTLKP